MIFSAFKTAKYRRFNYEPRTFDPEKRAREQRRQAIKQSKEQQKLNPQTYNARKRIEGGFERRRYHSEPQPMRQTLMFVVLILALSGGVYAYFFFDGFENLTLSLCATAIFGYVYFRIKRFLRK